MELANIIQNKVYLSLCETNHDRARTVQEIGTHFQRCGQFWIKVHVFTNQLFFDFQNLFECEITDLEWNEWCENVL